MSLKKNGTAREPEASERGTHALRRGGRAYALLAMVAIAAVLGVATYAWFTNNMKVNTNSVSVHSDTSELTLQMGDANAGSWSSDGDVALSTNAPENLTLSPVSTFDLTGFAECLQDNSNGEASYFEQAEDGQHFYHGWVDLRPQVTGTGASKVDGKVSLYLDGSLVPEGADATLLRASRVGIKISSGGQVLTTDIFALDNSDGGHRSEHPATAPAGLAGYRDGMLLGWKDGQLACGEDVTQDFSGYVMDTGDAAGRPSQALATLSLGQTYRLDVYYYIEGTDPDSADYLYESAGTLHVGLFATLDGDA